MDDLNHVPRRSPEPPQVKEIDTPATSEMALEYFLDSDEVYEALATWFAGNGHELTNKCLLERLEYLKQLMFERAAEEMESDTYEDGA